MHNDSHPIGFLRYIRPSFTPLSSDITSVLPDSVSKNFLSKESFETEYACEIYCLYVSTHTQLVECAVRATNKTISIKDNYHLVHILFGWKWKFWCFFIRLISGNLTLGEWCYLSTDFKAYPIKTVTYVKNTQLPYNIIPPDISVIIPTRNRRELLDQLIQSLEVQSIRPNEIIIIDQSDRFEYLHRSAAGIPITHVHQTDKTGPAAARNKGISLAKGELYLFIDDDMIIPPNLIESHLSSFSDHYIHVSAGVFFELPNKNPATGNFLLPSQIPGNNFMTTKYFWEVMGGFDETLDGLPLEDTELFLRSMSLKLAAICNPSASSLHLKHLKGGMRELLKDFSCRLYTNDIRFLKLYRKHYPQTRLIWFKFEHLLSNCYGIWVHPKRTFLSKCGLIIWRILMESIQLPLFWWRIYSLSKYEKPTS